MGEKPDNSDSLFTLPVVLGVIVVLGGVAALAVSGLFVYRAHLVSLQTQRMQAQLQSERDLAEHSRAERERAGEESTELEQSDGGQADTALPAEDLVAANTALFERGRTRATSLGDSESRLLKPGQRLQAQRPIHWDQAEIVDILEDQRVKIRWLSGEPGESIIAAELVRSDIPTTQ